MWPGMTPPRRRAHPRSRGENPWRSWARGVQGGSSPLTRGKLIACADDDGRAGLIPAHAGKTQERPSMFWLHPAHPRSRGENICEADGGGDAGGLIPAHAGKTRGRWGWRPWWRAHPRSRGENRLPSCVCSRTSGSSPLTRGKPHVDHALGHGSGLIPAHAGKTTANRGEKVAGAAHPRSRGENTMRPPERSRVAGSSPLTRGKPATVIELGGNFGLIPAHAGKTSRALSALGNLGAHPRSRGENPKPPYGLVRARGSSPLTRGKRPPPSRLPSDLGLIPAHAGKTRVVGVHDAVSWAHPRSRGENSTQLRRDIWNRGSSPLTRGKRVDAVPDVRASGLIPAHAGKTERGDVGPLSGGAHPRSRGENYPISPAAHPRTGSSPLTRGKPGPPGLSGAFAGLIPAHAGKTDGLATLSHALSGSSPLTRGKRKPAARRGEPARLIPAHAGKTGRWSEPRRPPRAHPRSRGENRCGDACGVVSAGSSPLTRGKLSVVVAVSVVIGFIPAHAGKTGEGVDMLSKTRAHPRSRGENLTGRQGLGKSWGSSPLTRGKHVNGELGPYIRGLIPAHAGKTCPKTTPRSGRPAHPRSRGENGVAFAACFGVSGSSPLTRGKRRGRPSFHSTPGLIPAHAGKTYAQGLSRENVRAHPRSRGEND